MNRNLSLGQVRGTAVALLVALAAFAIMPNAGRAQVISNVATVNLNAAIVETIAVSVSANTVNFNLQAGTGPTAGAPTVSVTTAWNVHPGPSPTLSLYGYFASSTIALTDGAGSNIASALVLSSVNAGAASPFNQTGPFGAASASRQLFSLGITGANKVGTRTDTLDLSIDLTTLPNQPAGTYTGVLSLQARAL